VTPPTFFIFSIQVLALPDFKQLLSLLDELSLRLGSCYSTSPNSFFRIFNRAASTSSRLGLVNQ